MEDNNFFLKGEASNQLRSIGRWTTFFAILQLIGVIFMLLVGVCCFICGIVMSIASGEIAEAIASAFADQYPSVSPIAIIWIYALVYLIFGGLYIPYTIYLFRASKSAREASENLDVVVHLREGRHAGEDGVDAGTRGGEAEGPARGRGLGVGASQDFGHGRRRRGEHAAFHRFHHDHRLAVGLRDFETAARLDGR